MEALIETAVEERPDFEKPVTTAVATVTAEIAFKASIATQQKKYEGDMFLDAEGEINCAKAIEAGLFARDKLEALVWALDYRRDLEAVARIGDEAYDRMVMSGILFARSVAYERRSVATRSNVPMGDVVGAANVALMKSVQRWDYAKGFRFLTFAAPTIRGHVMKYIATQRTGNRLDTERLQAFSRTREELTHQYKREPSNSEVVAELGWTTAQYERYVRAVRVEDIDTPIAHDGLSFGEILRSPAPTPEELHERHEFAGTISKVLDTFAPRERTIIMMRYGIDGGDGATQKEIGDAVGLSQMQVSRIEQRLLKKLSQMTTIQEMGRLFLGVHNKKDA